MQPITVLLVDDHKLARQGMRVLFDSQPDLQVIAEAGTGQEALELIGKLSPNIVFLDMMMPDTNGIEVAKIVRQRYPKTKLVFLSMCAEASYVVRALQSGALGYVLKDSDFSEILEAIRCALAGKRYLSTAIANQVFEILLNSNIRKEDSLDVLSPREREVLQLVAEGNSNAVIAQNLSLSVRTIEAHRAHITAKLRFNSPTDLVRYAIQQGLVLP
jgi:DNA-binding NarL/FixJ family response regulator